jgi:hypothetical protein
MIIHDTPKRSATMPKREEKKVFVNGICTCPPSVKEPGSGLSLKRLSIVISAASVLR